MLSPMAKGIQTLHSTVEMYNRFSLLPEDSLGIVHLKSKQPQYKILNDWALNHKTVISLNAGVSDNLDGLCFFLESQDNFYPWADFHEDEYSLKGVRTAVSLVLTEKIYETARLFRTRNFEWDFELGRVRVLNSEKLDVADFQKIEEYGRFNFFEMELVLELNNYRLAN
jgi:hypothetical protein